MPKGFTGIRLLLAFIAINTILFLMLVTAMTSAHPWLANVLPGQFAGGVNSSGYWVFFALVLLVNALAVLLAGFVLIVPSLLDAPADERRIGRLLTNRGGISDEAKEACLAVIREETNHARQQMSVGRTVLVSGAIFLVLAFVSVSLTLIHAMPGHSLFSDGTGVLQNAVITTEQVWRFTADQIAGALALDIPEIYRWHFGNLQNNGEAPLFTDFVFGFRAILGWIGLVTVITLVRSARLPSAAKPPAETSPAKTEEA